MSKNIEENADTIDLDGDLPDSGPTDGRSRFPIEVDTRFKFVKQLGRGGMGMVYQAYDEMLQRHVALKFLINQSHDYLPLLVAEARAQAKLAHKYLCPIHEVLESGQNVYLVMQYIEGGNLQELSNTLTQEQNLLLIMQCAQALEAAHRTGMVHRDFKPLNVMIKASDEGFEPSIVDFGLACSTAQTEKQPRLVSLRFTAPEQLSRNPPPIDRRVDVYSLGATLYYCLLRESPPQLDDNNPRLPTHNHQWQTLPKDIQLIIEQCMLVDLSARYASAELVAKDIQRYLNGEPISVHKGWFYKATTKVKKHKWLALAVSAALGVSVTALVNQRNESIEQAMRETALVKYNNQIKELEHEVQLTLLSPRHNITQKRQRWLQSALKIEQNLPNIEPVIRSTAQYAIGRIYLVVNDIPKALLHLKQAHQKEASPMTAFYLAIAYTERFNQEVEKLRTIKDDKVRQARLDAANSAYKSPALTLLAANLSSASYPAYAEALLAYLRDDWDEVLRILSNADELPSWFYHDELLKGDIALSKASDLFNQGWPVGDVLQQVKFAEENYVAASLIAKSDPEVAMKPYSAALFGLRVHTQAGLPWENTPLLALKTHYDELSQIDSNSASFHTIYGQTAHFYGLHLHYTDGNSQQWFEIAEQELLAANQLAKPQSRLWMSLAQLYTSMFNHLTTRNLPANAATQKAVDAMNKVPTEQRDYYYFNELGTLYRFRAMQQQLSGKSSRELFDHSVTAYLEAYERFPEFSGSLINAASTLERSTTVQDYPARVEALAKGRRLLNKAMQSDHGQFVPNYYLAVFDVEAVMLALHHGKPTAALIESADTQIQHLKIINQSHPYILDVELRLQQFRAEVKFTETGKWPLAFDALWIARKDLLKQFPHNTVVMANLASTSMELIGIRQLLGLPIEENLDSMSRAIQQFPDFQGVNAYRAMIDLYRYWRVDGVVTESLLAKYQLRSLEGHRYQWIKTVVMAYETNEIDVLNQAKQQLQTNLVILPAHKRLLLTWIEQKASRLTQ